jgi:hypothetical protein
VQPIYVARVDGQQSIHLLLVLAVLAFVAGIAISCLLIILDSEGLAVVWLLCGAGSLSLALAWLFMPKLYELWPDRLGVVHHFPWYHRQAGLKNMVDVTEARWWQAHGWYAYDHNYATSAKALVIRHQRPGFLWHRNIVISPENREEFLSQVQAVLARLQEKPS